MCYRILPKTLYEFYMLGPLLATFTMIAVIKVAMDVAWSDPFEPGNTDDVVLILMIGSVLAATVFVL